MCLYRGCMTVILFFYTVITYLPIRSKYVPGIDFFCKIPVENNRFLCPSYLVLINNSSSILPVPAMYSYKVLIVPGTRYYVYKYIQGCQV